MIIRKTKVIFCLRKESLSFITMFWAPPPFQFHHVVWRRRVRTSHKQLKYAKYSAGNNGEQHYLMKMHKEQNL